MNDNRGESEDVCVCVCVCLCVTRMEDIIGRHEDKKQRRRESGCISCG